MTFFKSIKRKICSILYPEEHTAYSEMDHTWVHPTKVVLMGDSNLFYDGTRTWKQHIPGLKDRSTAQWVKEYLPKVQIVPVPELELFEMEDWKASRMWDALSKMLDGKILVVIWIGQNDCDKAEKNFGSRRDEHSFVEFRERVKRHLDRKEDYFKDAIKSGKVKLIWIVPSDDSKFNFTRDYLRLVQILREEILTRPNHLQLPDMDRREYEDDHYHMMPKSRMETGRILAERIRELL
jgi:hypothetical protein